jgi:anti-sigma regulatory factor (Ser/Thr protein kinase)
LRGVGLSRLDDEQCEALLAAASEALANAWMYGQAPITLRAWLAPERVLVSVHDCGPGPSDPFVGMFSTDDEGEGGRGLWICQHLPVDVSLAPAPDGFTVRINCEFAPVAAPSTSLRN